MEKTISYKEAVEKYKYLWFADIEEMVEVADGEYLKLLIARLEKKGYKKGDIQIYGTERYNFNITLEEIVEREQDVNCELHFLDDSLLSSISDENVEKLEKIVDEFNSVLTESCNIYTSNNNNVRVLLD